MREPARRYNWFEGEFKEDKKDGFGVYYSGKKVYMGI